MVFVALDDRFEESSASSALIDAKVLDNVLYLRSRNETNISSSDFQNLDLRHLVDFAVLHQVKCIFYMSTGKVYGRFPSGRLLVGNTDLDSLYSRYHFSRELYLINALKDLGIALKIIRPFNIFGSTAKVAIRRGTLVPINFVLQTLRESRISLKTIGEQILNFQSVKQLSSNIIQLIDSPPGIYNLGSMWFPSVKEVTEIVSKVAYDFAGINVDIQFGHEEVTKSNSFEIMAPEGVEIWNKNRTKSEFVIYLRNLFEFLETEVSDIKRGQHV